MLNLLPDTSKRSAMMRLFSISTGGAIALAVFALAQAKWASLGLVGAGRLGSVW